MVIRFTAYSIAMTSGTRHAPPLSTGHVFSVSSGHDPGRKRYRDRPMDFADATLVHADSKLKLADIVTIDHDDFETYRMVGRRKFRILPERRAATR